MSCALDRFGSNSFPPVYWILRGMEKLNFEYFYNFNDIRDVGIIQLNIISKILLIYILRFSCCVFRKQILITKRIIKDRHEYFQIRLNSGNEFAKASSHLSCRVVIDVNNIRIKWIFVLDKDTYKNFQ